MIEELIKKLNKQEVQLVAVSKTRSNEQIMELYDQGQRHFGENRVPELVNKYDTLPKDIKWHLIGHLQTNKVKPIAGFVDLIHSVDSLKLLKEINKQAKKNERAINVLLQMHIAEEEAKYGLQESDLEAIFDAIKSQDLQNIKVCGLMGMATYSDNNQKIAQEFSILKGLFDRLKGTDPLDKDFKIVSMGMSGDYEIAIQEGSNMVRIGSLLFA